MKLRNKTTKFATIEVTITECVEIEYDVPPALRHVTNGEYLYQEQLKENASDIVLQRIQRVDTSFPDWHKKQVSIKTKIL